MLIQEDLGRLVRGHDAVRLWGIAVDHGTHCIAPHDACDTFDPGWEEPVLQACANHVGHNAHTSKRIKHKLMNRFKKFGAAVALVVAGYVKPAGAETYYDWRKMDEWTETIQQGLRMLKQTGNCSAVADYFNEVGFPVGAHATNAKWDGRMVRRFYQNPLLAGRPGRGFKSSVKHHETGRRMSVKNTASEPFLLNIPHLAHVNWEELAAVNDLLGDQNANFSRRRPNGVDPMARKVKKRTRFPGQHARCLYCGRQYVWGGNGVTESLMCNGARDWHCWNSIGVKGKAVRETLTASITRGLQSLEGFSDQFAALVELSPLDGNIKERRDGLQERQRQISQEQQNLSEAIAKLGLTDYLQAKFKELEAARAAVSLDLVELDLLARKDLQLPRSATELRLPLEEQFARLAEESWEFGDLMR